MYAVIEFVGSDIDESSNEVAIVPLIWLTKQEKRCHWPNKIGKVNFTEFVKNLTPHKSTWPTYKVYKIHLKTDDYDEAETFISNFIKEINVCNASSVESAKSIFRKSVASDEKEPKGHSVMETVSNASTLTIVEPTPSPCASSASRATGFEDIILQEVLKLTSIVDQQTVILNEILRNSRSQINASLVPITPAEMPKLPLKILEEFHNFEKRIKTDESFKKYMISRLSAVGGSGLEGLTGRILKFLLTDRLAMSFNWKGRGDKQPFSNTSTMDLILEAAKIHFPENERSDCIINNTVKDWLKYATSRGKTRKEEN